MKTKIYVVITYFSLFLISACCEKTNTFNTIVKSIDIELKESYIKINNKVECDLILNDSIVSVAYNFNHLNMGSSLYAYDFDKEDRYIPQEEITDIKILTLTEFSNQYLQNNYITDLFTVRFFNWKTQQIETISISQFLSVVGSRDSKTAKLAEISGSTFILSGRPTNSKKQKLKFEVEFSNSSILTAETDSITFE
jgi:hypothetical protein